MDKITGNISPINKINGNITYGNGSGETVPIYEGNYEASFASRHKKADDKLPRTQPYGAW